MKSGFQMTWTFVCFRFPTDTNAARAAGRRFMKALREVGGISGGFGFCRGGRGSGLIATNYAKVSSTLAAAIPPDGELRLVPVTDKQIEHGHNFWGTRRLP